MICERPNALNFVWNLGRRIGFGLDVFVRISRRGTVIGEHHGSGDVGGLAGCRIEGRQY